MKRYLITSALPYANGPIHFGHIAGVYLPADLYTRHLRLKKEKVIHICGSDEHGVAIMQNAQKAHESYQSYVNKWHNEHKELFKKYEIEFDYFGQTSKEYHHEEVLKWFKELNDKGFIEKKAEDQLQCQDCHNYLPDRYVEGTCYNCGYAEARGDECPSCGEWINAVKLINPKCKFCGSKNILVKSVDQWYLMLSKYHHEFRSWFESKSKEWRKSVYSFVDSLSRENMVDRAITRDLDWGIDVPLPEAKNKKFYVWFDAPIGYISNTKEYCKTSGEDYLKDWWQNKNTVITNFIGKDNIIFHAIIFPMMCMASGRALPVTNLPANQYVNLEGKQFSKSKGWYIDAENAINEFGSDALRFYLINLIPETADSSYTWKGFEAKLNNELANNIGNFVTRSLKFAQKNWPLGLDPNLFDKFYSSKLWSDLTGLIKEYHETMDSVGLKKGMDTVMQMGALANGYFTECAPWAQYKTDVKAAEETIANSFVMVFYIGVFMSPFLPGLSAKLLSNFAPIAEDLKSLAYQGNKDKVLSFLRANNKLACEVTGPVPKIDPKRILELEAELLKLV